MARTAQGFRLPHDGPLRMTARRSNGRDLTFRRLRLCSRFRPRLSTTGLRSNFHLREEGRHKAPNSIFGKDNTGNGLKPNHFSGIPTARVAG
jgi:hypothetical protein